MSGKGVARRVAHRIGFRLDDSAAHPALRQVVDQCLADQEARKLHGIDGQIGPAKTPDAISPCWWRVSMHAIAGMTVDQYARRAGPDASVENKSGANAAPEG